MATDSTDLADTSLFDDDDLFAIPVFKAKQPEQGAQAKKTDVLQYVRQVECEAIEECNLIINAVVEESFEKSKCNYERYTVYFHCPICLTPGSKDGFTIQHIKACAGKNFLAARDVISLLKHCPKTQNLKINKQSSRSKPGTSKVKAKKRNQTYELLIFDDQYRAQIVMKRSSKLVANGAHCPKQSANSDTFLPSLWKLSHLASESCDEYVLSDFRKYFDDSI